MTLYKYINGNRTPLSDNEIDEYNQRQIIGSQTAEENAANQYKEDRRSSYPAMGDQWDALYKYLETQSIPIDSELGQMIELWRSVKEQYPKPGGGL